MQYIVTVDQIQEGIATLIDDATGEICFKMPLALLPEDVADGDVLDFSISINKEEKINKEQSVMDLLRELTQGKHLK